MNKNKSKIKEAKCPTKNSSICPTSKSFENSGAIITDNEYEVDSEIENKSQEKKEERN